MFFRGLTWAILCAWTQNHPKNFGTCPGLPFQLTFQNLIFQNDRPEPPPPLIKTGLKLYTKKRVLQVTEISQCTRVRYKEGSNVSVKSALK